MAWAFWGISDFDQDVHIESNTQLDAIIKTLKQKKFLQLKKGYNPDINLVLLNSNKVEANPKPFVIYVGMFVLYTICKI